MDIQFKASPNFWKDRKYGQKSYTVKYIFIHWFGSGTLESAEARFLNKDSQASAHYGISKGRVRQWVQEKDGAWSTGVALANLEGISIEHDANPNQPLSEQDYELSGQLVAEISKRHNIPLDRVHIKGHREVKATQCPGTVDIDRIIRIAKGYLAPLLPMKFRAVRRKTNPTVYAVAGESLFPFSSPKAFLFAGGTWEKVEELSDEEFYKFQVLNDTPIIYNK